MSASRDRNAEMAALGGGDVSAKSSSTPNDYLLWFIVFLLTIVVIPLGSNRPFFWACNAVLVGMAAIAYCAMHYRSGSSIRIKLADIPLLAWLFGLFCLGLVAQLIPLPTFEPSPSTIAPAWRSLSWAPGATLLMLMRTLTYGLFFFLVLQLGRHSGRSRVLLDLMVGINAGFAMVGLISLRAGDTILGMPKWAYLGSATGTFVNRNSFATFLAMGGVLAACLLLDAVADLRNAEREEGTDAGHWTRIVLIAAALAIIAATLAASQSRLGVASALVGLLVVVVSAFFRFKRLGRRSMILGASFAGLLLLAGLLNSGGLVERMASLGSSMEIRTDLYWQILELIRQRPWTGHGGGSFEVVFPLVHDFPVGVDRLWDKAHNSYLALWAEMGVVIGSIPPLIFCCAAILARRGLRRNAALWLPVTCLYGVTTVGGLHSLGDFSLEIQANTFWILAVMALGVAPALPMGPR